MSEDIQQRAKLFASGRIGAGQFNRGPETGFQPMWLPTVASHCVRNSDDPPDGFDTARQAMDAAKRYRASVKAYLRAGMTKSPPIELRSGQVWTPCKGRERKILSVRGPVIRWVYEGDERLCGTCLASSFRAWITKTQATCLEGGA